MVNKTIEFLPRNFNPFLWAGVLWCCQPFYIDKKTDRQCRIQYKLKTTNHDFFSQNLLFIFITKVVPIYFLEPRFVTHLCAKNYFDQIKTNFCYIWIPTYFLFSMYDKFLLSIFLRALITAGCHNLFIAILKMLPSSLSKSTKICMSKASQWGQKNSEFVMYIFPSMMYTSSFLY